MAVEARGLNRGKARIRAPAGATRTGRGPGARDRRRGGGLHGVIDIGSNSIRLVVFERDRRVPAVLFNEKVMCGLGRSLEQTGRLDKAGTELALTNLARFADLVGAMRISTIDAVATAAVREAADGPAFVAKIGARCGLKVRILSGAEEAEMSALGVLSGIPQAHGIMGDLGGASVELVELANGKTGRHATLPIGPFRILGRSAGKRSAERDFVDRALAPLDWLGERMPERLYAVGGAWRALARLHMAQTNDPFRMIHRYAVRGSQAREFASLVARQSPGSLAALDGTSRRRAELLPAAALVLERVLEIMRPEEVVFSAYGLREGIHFARLPRTLRAADPLLAGCRAIAERVARVPKFGEEVADWIAPLFADETPAQAQLRVAACLLGDLAWRVHPDYRAEHALTEVLRLPDLALDHGDRAFLALAVAGRYTSKEAPGFARKVEGLLPTDQAKRARALGFAVRLAHTLSGAIPRLLRHYRLTSEGGTLVLAAEDAQSRLIGEIVQRRFEALADQLGLKPVIVPAKN